MTDEKNTQHNNCSSSTTLKSRFIKKTLEMKTNYRLDKSFGPIGVIAGITILIAGILLVPFSLAGIFLVLIGAFVGLTSTSTIIDYEKKRMKFSNNLFGLMSVGKWITVEHDMKIRIKKSNKTWRNYSRGNRTLDITNQDFRIILYDSADRQVMPISKASTMDLATEKMKEINEKLGLSAN
jgi:membrane protein implicated in regulation of membrane protease activity